MRIIGAFLVLSLVAALPVRATTVGPRRVYAHYMGCLPAWNRHGLEQATAASDGLRHPKNFYHTCGGQFMNLWLVPPGTATNDEACARLEIARAKRAGVDGFVFDAWAGGGPARDLLDVFFKVVEEDKADFALTICFDADCHRPNDKSKPTYEKFAESARDLLAKHGDSPALARRNGKPLLFTYHLQHVIGREGPWAWKERRPLVEKGWREFRRLVGTPVYLHGCIDGIPGIEREGPLRYEVADWAARHFEAVGGFLGVKGDWRLDPKIAEVVKSAGAEWSQPVFPQFVNHGWWIYSQAGYDTFRNNWQAAVDTGSTLIQVVTWNDYGEETAIAPNFGSAYTTLRLNRHFAERWKTGREPRIERDEAHVCFRRAVGTPDAFPFRSRRIGKLPDVLEVFTFLTQPGRVSVPGYGDYDAPAGYHYRQFPLKVGKVAVRVHRDGKTVCGCVAPEEVSDRRWREDAALQAYGSNFDEEWRTDFPDAPALRYSENGDADDDGLPNWFEMVHFGRWPDMATATVADPSADPDGDGATNLEEYRRGTDPTKADAPYAPGFVWSSRLPTRLTERKPWAEPMPIDGVFNPERDAKGAPVWWWLSQENGRWTPAGEGDFDHRDWAAAKSRSYWAGFRFEQDGRIDVKQRDHGRPAVAWESPVDGTVDACVTMEGGRTFEKKAVAVTRGRRILFPDDFADAPRDVFTVDDFRVTLVGLATDDSADAAAVVTGRDAWAGLRPHPAVVNSVVQPPDDPNVISLRGEWSFITNRFGSKRYPIIQTEQLCSGCDHLWKRPERVMKIRVPGNWEAQGIGMPAESQTWVCKWDASPQPLRHAFWGEGWYAKTLRLPSDWKGRRIWLKTGVIGTTGYLWVNARPVACVTLYCGTVKYDITDFVRFGEENRVVVQALNVGVPNRMGGLASCNSWGGILRDIELEATPFDAWIDDCWVRGDFDRQEAEVHVDVNCSDCSDCSDCSIEGRRWSVQAEIDGTIVRRAIEQSNNPNNQTILKVPLRDFRAWSPEHPNLYTARVELVENGQVVQTRYERFGVRKFEVRGREFYLNGKPFFMRGIGWHNIYPLTGAMPADREVQRKIARRIKNAGFNFCRFHTHCRFPEVFEVADELGIMLQPELPYYNDVPCNGQVFDPFTDAKEIYENFRRHPSFAVLSGGNEGSFGPETSKRFYAFYKRLDPDRVVIGQDGFNNIWTNKRGTSDYEGGPMNVWPRGSVETDAPFVAHEYLNLSVKADSRVAARFTGVRLPPGSRAERAAWLGRFGIGLEQGDRLQDAQARMQKLWRKYGFEQARLDPQCDGYSYWSLQDTNSKSKYGYSGQGLFNPFCEDKPFGDTAESVRVYNAPTCLLFDTDDRTYGPEAEKARWAKNPFGMHLTDFATNRVRTAGEKIAAHFSLAHYGDAPLAAGRLDWRLTTSGGVVLASGSEPVAAQDLGAVRPIATFDIRVPEVGTATRATLTATFAGVSNAWDWWLFPRRTPLDGRGVFVAPEWRARLAPRLAGCADDLGSADTVIAPAGGALAAEARRLHKNLITLAGQDGEVNITLGWWWMGKQMGLVLEDRAELKTLPHDGLVSPLLFRIVKTGAEMPVAGFSQADQVVYCEGGEACYSYLAAKTRADGRRETAVNGLDLLADVPEADAILGGLIRASSGFNMQGKKK